MTDELATRRARHQRCDCGQGTDHCRQCLDLDWPCTAAALGDALEELQAAADMMDAELMDRRRACDAFRTELEQARQARQAAEQRADQFWHRTFTLECDRDRLRDDLAASELIAARYAAALARIRDESIDRRSVALARQALAEEG